MFAGMVLWVVLVQNALVGSGFHGWLGWYGAQGRAGAKNAGLLWVPWLAKMGSGRLAGSHNNKKQKNGTHHV